MRAENGRGRVAGLQAAVAVVPALIERDDERSASSGSKTGEIRREVSDPAPQEQDNGYVGEGGLKSHKEVPLGPVKHPSESGPSTSQIPVNLSRHAVSLALPQKSPHRSLSSSPALLLRLGNCSNNLRFRQTPIRAEHW